MKSNRNNQEFNLEWRGMLSDYVTAVTWSATAQILAACSAAGEVVLWDGDECSTLQPAIALSVDCLSFSGDGQFLAAGGQDGKVRIWRLSDGVLITTLENAPAWVDRLVWSPKQNLLAFSLGRYVQVWDADTHEIAVTLNFDTSSVLGIDWSGDGRFLAIGGYQGVKVWQSGDWDEDPYVLPIPSASLAIAWSGDSKYLASGNMDRTITVVETESLLTDVNPQPWVMRGFPGKIRQLTWSQANQKNTPLLAAASVEGIAVWSKLSDESLGWEARILTNHSDVIQAVAFQPHSLLLASAAADGWLCLWHQAKRIGQILQGTAAGFSCLAWHPQGNLLAAGGHNGELLVWTKILRGQGFGKA